MMISQEMVLLLPVIVPLAAALLGLLWLRRSRLPGLAGVIVTALGVGRLGWEVVRHGPLVQNLGGWTAPLGITLRADGPALFMMLLLTLLALPISFYACHYFQEPATEESSPSTCFFWPLWLMLLAAMNNLVLTRDLFNIYVSLELVGLAAVGLTTLSGKPAAVSAALRYLLVSLLGSLSYLLGVGFLYKTYGILDIATLRQVIGPLPAVRAAMALITGGLLLKTALFPLHFWLPTAHAQAPAPVSAILSGMVVKVPWYLLWRFWFELFPVIGSGVIDVLGFCGGLAIIWGSLQAWRQERLKMLVAYSTVAQLGYLFLAFPLHSLAGGNQGREAAFFFALCHGCAKAAMFLAAGCLVRYQGHDYLAQLEGVRARLPVAAFAFALAGVSIAAIPLSGGFMAKYQYVALAMEFGQWPIVWLIIGGSLLGAAYVYRALRYILCPLPVEQGPVEPPGRVSLALQWWSLFLALLSLLLGVVARFPLSLLEIGQ